MVDHQSQNVLITNFHCASNRGDAAILEGISNALDKELLGSQITATEYPDASTYINDIESIEQRTVPFRIDRPRRTAAYIMDMTGITDISRKIRSWVEENLNLRPYYESDIIIGTGGHYLTEIYYPGKLGVLWELNYCKELGKPVVLCGQSFGPVTGTPYKHLTKHVLNKIDAITVRDRQSKHNLESIGVTTDIYLTADAAFAMDLNPAEEKTLSNRRLEPLPEVNGSPIFTVSVREWDYFEEGGMTEYLQGVSDLCEFLVEEYDGTVYLLSTCTGFDGYHTDDRVTGHKVYDELPDSTKSSVQIIMGEYTPQELICLLRKVDFHIGTRMHSIILALLAKTPVIGIEYQFKTSGLMKMFDLEKYVLPIEQVTSTTLQELFSDGYRNKSEIENKIHTYLPDIQKQAKRNGEIVADVLQDYS